ncbi:MAG: metal ABC transporter substrate-binding protein [Clostridiales bacterium]|jgi:zinc transport system substrate-binding protein|nr:metal ABC transporter substrate-binding protein [Clostridiales bacterium]
MKKTEALLLIVALIAITLSSCARRELALSSNSGKISVVSTIFPGYDFAREISAGKADVYMLLPPGSESHSFEPTPADIIMIQNCDVFIYAGGESDEWVRGILDSMDTGNMKVISMIDCVDAVEEELAEGMEEEEEEDPAEPEYDEHVWTSPKNAALIATSIKNALCESDPANASSYESSASMYIAKLEKLDLEFMEVIGKATRKTIVFGDRFPFRYLADAYGLDYYAAFPGCSTETECSAATVAFLIDKVKAENIPVVFHIELSNEKIANAISEESGAGVRLLHAVHNISKADFDAGEGYVSLMEKNVEALKEALL